MIDHLAYSPDGHWLAGSFGGSNGMRLLAVTRPGRTVTLVTPPGADFSRESQIRLYAGESRALRKLAWARPRATSDPSPPALDGRHIEMGFDDATAAKA